jgi:hypothetical protein
MPIIGVRCPVGASVAYRRRTVPATPATDMDKAAATGIDSAVALYSALVETINAPAQIGKPTPVIDAAKQGLGDALEPAGRKADAANHAEAAHLIPEDLSIPEFLRREKDEAAA